MEKRQSLQQVVLGKLATCKSMKLEYSLTPYTKINSNWFKNLNVRHGTIKILERNIGKTLFDIYHGNIFLAQPPKTKEIKVKRNKRDQSNLKAYAQQKKPSTKLKDNLWNRRKCFQRMQLTKG